MYPAHTVAGSPSRRSGSTPVVARSASPEPGRGNRAPAPDRAARCSGHQSSHRGRRGNRWRAGLVAEVVANWFEAAPAAARIAKGAELARSPGAMKPLQHALGRAPRGGDGCRTVSFMGPTSSWPDR